MNITNTVFGAVNGVEVGLFSLSNDNGLTVKVTNYGGIITSIEMPDREGRIENIVCGFDTLEGYLNADYLNNYPYFGCMLGRVANRIAKGRYEIDGQEFTGVINNGPNHLHGGTVGFDRRIWQAETSLSDNHVCLLLKYTSPDGEEGYPGTLKAEIMLLLTGNDLGISYTAHTDKPTPVNLSNHTYFNLSGGKENIFNHVLQLNASTFTEMEANIPTGRILPVEGTEFDFRAPKRLGDGIARLPQGYDDNYVIDNPQPHSLVAAAALWEPKSGRRVEIATSQPGLQLYTGYWIPELTVGGVKKFGRYSGVALETQHFPDSLHHSHFPSVVLRPDENYREVTAYSFLTE
ncbi:MAG: galactose mutarotase [Bacteroidales bacterium]|jgi:aldose 1-epimerase|nr:galactose mutarotase [Bacteroidales bacterium]